MNLWHRLLSLVILAESICVCGVRASFLSIRTVHTKGVFGAKLADTVYKNPFQMVMIILTRAVSVEVMEGEKSWSRVEGMGLMGARLVL